MIIAFIMQVLMPGPDFSMHAHTHTNAHTQTNATTTTTTFSPPLDIQRTRTTLSYYESAETAEKQLAATGVVEVASVTNALPSTDHGFDVAISEQYQQEELTLHCKAATEQLCDTWIDAINDAVASVHGAGQESSVSPLRTNSWDSIDYDDFAIPGNPQNSGSSGDDDEACTSPTFSAPNGQDYVLRSASCDDHSVDTILDDASVDTVEKKTRKMTLKKRKGGMQSRAAKPGSIYEGFGTDGGSSIKLSTGIGKKGILKAASVYGGFGGLDSVGEDGVAAATATAPGQQRVAKKGIVKGDAVRDSVYRGFGGLDSVDEDGGSLSVGGGGGNGGSIIKPPLEKDFRELHTRKKSGSIYAGFGTHQTIDTESMIEDLMNGGGYEFKHLSKEVATVIVKIMNKEPRFAVEAEEAKKLEGGATPKILKIAADQTIAAAGTIYCTVVELRGQWVANGGGVGTLPQTVEGYDHKADNCRTILPKLKAAEASLKSVFNVVLDSWKLDLGSPKTTTTKEFQELDIIAEDSGKPSMLSEIGVRTIQHHVLESAHSWSPLLEGKEWYTNREPPPSISQYIDIYSERRDTRYADLVPAILTDVALYNAAAEQQAKDAGPIVMERLYKVANNPGPSLTKKQIGIYAGGGGNDEDGVPTSRSLARLSFDQYIACSGSITLYKVISEAVARLKFKLSGDFPGFVLPGDVKTKERTIYKSALKYNGDTTECHDKIRCTVEVKTLADAAEVAEALVKLRPTFLIVTVKNRFDPDYDALPIGGYRDMQFSGLIKLDQASGRSTGVEYAWCEVQLNTTPMIKLKSGEAKDQSASKMAGHDAFKFARAINAFAPESFLYTGAWESGMAKRTNVGLLLEINLNGTRFKNHAQRDEFVEALCSKQCRVRKLDMGDMELGEEGGVTVGRMLKDNSSVTSITLVDNQLGEKAGKALSMALKVNSTLTAIDLKRNKLGEVGGKVLSVAMQVNTVLASINLENNNLGEVGGAAIGAALKINKALNSIKLGSNHLGEVAGIAIGEGLQVNTALTSIDLWSNGLRGGAGASIAAALKVNAVLQSITLNENVLDESAGVALAEAMESNVALTEFSVLNNKGLSPEIKARIKEVLERNLKERTRSRRLAERTRLKLN